MSWKKDTLDQLLIFVCCVDADTRKTCPSVEERVGETRLSIPIHSNAFVSIHGV